MDLADEIEGTARPMNIRPVLPALACMALLVRSSAWGASAGETWTAYSTTAMAITGDITISPSRITFANGKSLPLAPAGDVPVSDRPGVKHSAALFRVTAPDDPILLSGNRLCGGRTPQPVTFMTVWTPPRPGVGVELRSISAFSGKDRPTQGLGSCGVYNYQPGRISSQSVKAASGESAIHCPQTFQGKSFMQVTLYDGPPGMQMALKPLQDEAAEDSSLKRPVAGWDRWTFAPRPDHRRYTLVCHYSSAPHELWARQAATTIVDKEIQLAAWS
jgi:hypothetical protein